MMEMHYYRASWRVFFYDESTQVQLILLTVIVKLFLKTY